MYDRFGIMAGRLAGHVARGEQPLWERLRKLGTIAVTFPINKDYFCFVTYLG